MDITVGEFTPIGTGGLGIRSLHQHLSIPNVNDIKLGKYTLSPTSGITADIGGRLNDIPNSFFLQECIINRQWIKLIRSLYL